MHLDIRHGGDCLVFQLHFWALLVSDVSNGSGQIEITVNPAFDIDGRASFVNPVSLLFEVGLMVKGKRDSLSTFTDHAPRIAGVGTDEQAVDYHQHIGSAPLALHHLRGVLVGLDLRKRSLCDKIS